ncbi:carboxypeptidase regulatory-like domain-containing protein [Intrasporangium sp.]|uniref:carboxypeptidase regulatory-like domain-containing protein n=1 Tax=Intrasporangium sp. TaxID=1925024 RepID=UPI00293A1D14|nr:carboxypeptidase regulatory-like domain-containing protein [Intrasporangium sp.]MDV3219937.1 carboxypeptidase-like regulatory domain-containing protein [Intrasporangium sp.]
MSTHDLHPDDIELLERLGKIVEIVDPVPPDVVELGRAAFALHHADSTLMKMVTDAETLVALRSTDGARGTSHLLVFEHGPVSIELDVTGRGDFGRILGVVVDESGEATAGAQVVLETASVTRTVDLEDDRFTFERVPLGLARIALERSGERIMATTWFDVG